MDEVRGLRSLLLALQAVLLADPGGDCGKEEAELAGLRRQLVEMGSQLEEKDRRIRQLEQQLETRPATTAATQVSLAFLFQLVMRLHCRQAVLAANLPRRAGHQN